MDKVALFYSRILNPGGAERILIEEAKRFEMEGIEAKILTYEVKDDAIFGYKGPIEILKGNRVLSLRKALKDFEPDIAIANTSSDCIFLYPATFVTGVPYITHIHGTIFWFVDNPLKYSAIYKGVFDKIRNSLPGHKEFIRAEANLGFKDRIKTEALAALEWLGVRKAKVIITFTDHLRWEIKQLYGKDAEVIRGRLNSKVFGYKPKINIRGRHRLGNKKIILNIGRLDPRKRIDLLLRAFAMLERDDAVLLVGGKGKDEFKLKELAKDLGIEKDRDVIFLGFIPDEEYYNYMASCNVFAFPSWTSCGIPPYEAVALGKKVVWTSEADVPKEILSSEKVFLADPNPESFSEALGEALNSSKTGKAPDLSKYSLDEYFSKVLEICKRYAKYSTPASTFL